MTSTDLTAFLSVIAGTRSDRILEIRFALPAGGMGQVYTSPRALARAAETIASLTARTDVYVGAAVRCRRAGGRDAVTDAHLVFVEIDAPDADDALAGFLEPSMVIASGTRAHRHAYWLLEREIAGEQLEDINRRLAIRLGGDLSSADRARILRPPATLNHKHDPPQPVELLAIRPNLRYATQQLLDALPDRHLRSAPTTAPALGPTRPRRAIDDALRAIPADEYAFALTHRRATRRGKIVCPFHADHTPSLQLYADGTWFCFGCRRGGSIYDFAAALWHTGTKSSDFLNLRTRLADRFGLTPLADHA